MASPEDHDRAPEDLADETLLGALLDITSDQARDFYAGIASGAIDFDPGAPGAGIPPVLSALHGRRRDRNVRLSVHDPDEDPSLYGPAPETADTSALRALLWVARHDPQHPVRLTPSRTGMLVATYQLPGHLTVSHLLLYDRLTASSDTVVTAGSLATALGRWHESPGTATLPPGVGLDEASLVEVDEKAPRPVTPPEHAATERVLSVPLMMFSTLRLLPPPPGSAPEEALPVPAVTLGGKPWELTVLTTTLNAVGWLDPFAPDVEIDPDEDVFVGIGASTLSWWGNKTSVLSPRPR